MRSCRAVRKSKPRQATWEKFVEPLDEITPSALAGPGESIPTAATWESGTPVMERTLVIASASASTAASGPSRTRLGTSTRRSTRNRPDASSTVALLAVPPLSSPTTTHSSAVGIASILCPDVGRHATRPAWPPSAQDFADFVRYARGRGRTGGDADSGQERRENFTPVDPAGDLDVERRVAPADHLGVEVEAVAVAGRAGPLDDRLAHHVVEAELGGRGEPRHLRPPEGVGQPVIHGVVDVREVVGVEDDALGVALAVPHAQLVLVQRASLVLALQVSEHGQHPP